MSARLIDDTRHEVIGGDCAIGDERRPALGCTGWRARGAIPVEAGRPADLGFTVAPEEGGHPFFLRMSLWRPQLKEKQKQALEGPGVVRPLKGRATIVLPDFPPPDAGPGSAVLIWSRSPPWPQYESKPVRVAAGSRLTVGIGLDAASPPDGVESVVFTLAANTKDRWQQLLQVTVQPGSPSAAHWQDHLVPLDAVQGEATRFRFITAVKPLPGVSMAQAAAIPLWAAPEILTPTPDDDHPNVILVSLDTLRRDHVGALGSPLPLTPHIDAIAADGAVFENANTTYPSTTAGHLSMLTGHYPIRLGVTDPSHGLGRSSVMLAEALGAAGWRTGAVTEDGMLEFTVGFGRGMSSYWENLETETHGTPSRKVARTVDAAIAWMEQSRRDRFFLFVHTYAVHWPYLPPDEYRLTEWWDGTALRPVSEAPPAEGMHLQYAAEVRQADEQIGRLVDAVRRLGLERRTILIVTSDHGEGFFEHQGQWGHGTTIYDELMRVPVVLWGPGRIPAGRRVRTATSSVDLPPTILELAGVPPLVDIDGESQVARLNGGPEDLERVVFAQAPAIKNLHEDQLAARGLTRKWVRTASTPPTIVVYDLIADPKEEHPLDDPALVAEGERLFERYQALGAKAAAPKSLPISDEKRQRLRDLGYTE